ncbi:MAG: hypothetical protein RLZZ511_2030 [Cyanobacteriota bacterium]|jgi:hypothetical protein
MQSRFHAPLGVLIAGLLWQDARHLFPIAWELWFLVSGKLLFAAGLVWLGMKGLDWWGEEAPILHPYKMGKIVRLNYREAMARLRLIELFDGDARMARRQVRILMARYPGRLEQWYWEQAIVDIERDRA